MTFRLIALLTLLFAPIATAAQQVTVRSGDHENFARLVLNLPFQSDWTLENFEEGAQLTFGNQNFSFDTSQVFERITRERVTSITTDNDTASLVFKFACACWAEAFWFQQKMLVVDIRKKKPEEIYAQQIQLPTRSDNGSIDTAVSVPKLPYRGGAATVALTTEALSSQLAEAKRSPLRSVRDETQSANLDESREKLLRQIGRATSQGLLSPKSTKPRTDEPIRETDRQNEAPAEEIQRPEHTSPKPKNNFHINVRTSIDEDFLERLGGRDADAFSDGCLDAYLFDIASWGSDASFWEQVGPLRSRMTSEFDRNNDDAIRQLAKVYIFFGFGLEASQVANLLPPDEVETEVLTTLAEIMETGSAPQSALIDQLECDAPNVMWSALAHTQLPPDARLDKDAMLLGFSRLPRHLRSHLGPILASRLLEAGHKNESRSILRIIERGEDRKSTASNLAAADLDLGAGKNMEAEERLTSVIEANDALSPQALILQIDSHLKRGEKISYDVAQLAAAYAFEYENDPLGKELSRVHILALGASGAFQDAFDQLDKYKQSSQSLSTDIRVELAELLASNADQIEILRYVLSGNLGDAADLKPETVLKIAEQLLDAGFYAETSRVLARNFVGIQNRQARLLRAKAALASDRPRQAEVELLGLSGADANVLRAMSRSMTGEHRQAYELFKSAGMDEEASREAWLANGLSGADAGPADQAEEDIQFEDGVLARNKALLEAVDGTRDSLDSLLSEAPFPDLGS